MKIEQVFGSAPRAGGRYWWPRGKNLENDFRQLFEERTSKKVVIVDGPTGAGKTSLAYRALYLAKTSYNYYAVDDETTWFDLCRHVVSVPKARETTDKRKLQFSIKNFLPGGKADTEHEAKYDPLKDLEYSAKYIEQLNIDTLIDIMIKEGVSLILDDFEKANKDLKKKIANLGKKLSNLRHPTPHSKLIVISCKRTFEEFIEVDNTLDGRIFHITIGGLATTRQSWNFLIKGFEKLDIIHPGKSGIATEKNFLSDCIQFTYDATGGILKNLTDLGEKLARTSYRNKSLKAKKVISIAKSAAQKNINTYVRSFNSLTSIISSNEHVSAVISYLYRNGISKNHDFVKIQADIDKLGLDLNAESGVSELIDFKFIIPTGINGSRLFVSKPNYALAFVVAWYRKDIYRVPKKLKEISNQRIIPFVKNW